jgi:rhodanese-related sulfurtransferase
MRASRTRKALPPVITKDELKEKLVKGHDVQILNVADARHHELGMIAGSLKIPFAELAGRAASELVKSREVVTYGSDSACDGSRMAAELLLKKGYKASWYDGGIREWTAAGLPTD